MDLPADGELPSLPQVVLRALEACRSESDYRDIGRIISADTALCARVLALANSALYGRPGEINSIEQALLRLGTDQLQALIITASLRQLLFDLGSDRWQQIRDFWRHSLTTALTARALSRLTGYSNNEEAFMVGILHNVGELIALRQPSDNEHQTPLDDQIEIGARLANHWGLGQMATDAIRYQQAPARDIRDAGHLVKLINLSARLALADSSGIEAAQTIFGLTSALTREICTRIGREVSSLAESLDIPLEGPFDSGDAHKRLFEQVVRSAMVEQALQTLPEQANSAELLTTALRNLVTLTGRPGLVFQQYDDRLELLAATRTAPPHIEVPLDNPQSLVTQVGTLRETDVLKMDSATILDRQLLGLLDCRAMMSVPVCYGEQCCGVYVIGLDSVEEAETYTTLVELFARRVGGLAHALQKETRTEKVAGETLEQLSQRIELRKRVHEISNPLTIVRQYIRQLQNKLQDIEGSGKVEPDLEIVREELDRAAGMLERISEAGESGASNEQDEDGVVLNSELTILCDLFEEALFAPSDIQCELTMTTASTRARATRGPVRQMVMNLARNAVESMPNGGRIQFRTAAPIWQDGRRWIELTIDDSGQGIPESIRDSLFKPVRSTKGPGHSGLGLSIVKQLVDDMEGIISCRTGEDGTSFRILLPAVKETE
ncbi:HDOD domain-containing protein [Marinobacter nanhaiticus D15-8W]|uniref:histidine kinase n=1 Tax=Marinobacter nanhaiticus D15-8W TaxID=626887 RepID=N6X6C1_9GAMM|nr:HDOD domain-containing protein [Marinobacter nanhaiticus D15-8W]